MTIGEKIRKYRTKRGLSQKELAIKCKMSEPAIRNYELGNRTPNNNQLEIIALALEVSIYAISNPNLENEYGVMHALYYLEEAFDFRIKEDDSGVCIVCDNSSIRSRLTDWGDTFNDYKAGKIDEEEYAAWKDSYPEEAVFNKR